MAAEISNSVQKLQAQSSLLSVRVMRVQSFKHVWLSLVSIALGILLFVFAQSQTQVGEHH